MMIVVTAFALGSFQRTQALVALSGIVVTPNPANALAVDSTYTVDYVAGADLAVNERISVTFPVGTGLASVDITNATIAVAGGGAVPIPALLVAGETVHFSNPVPIASGEAVSVVFGNASIVNPVAGTMYQATITTSNRGGEIDAPIASADYIITAAGPPPPTVTPNPLPGYATGATYTLTMTAIQALVIGEKSEITFPATTDVSGIDATNATIALNGGGAAAITTVEVVSPTVLRIVLPGPVSAADDMVIVVGDGGIANPVPGDFTASFRTLTAADAQLDAPVESDAFTLTAPMDPGAPVVTPTPAAPDAGATYTVVFLAGSALNVGDEFNLHFPAGTNISGVTAVNASIDIDGGPQPLATATPTMQRLTIVTPIPIVLPAVVTLVLGNDQIINPTDGE